MGSLPTKAPGAVPGRLPGQVPGGSGKVPGRFRGRFRITGSGKVPGAANHGFREGSGAGSERQVVPGRFWAVSGAGSEPRVLGQVSGDRVPPGRFQNGSGQVSRL